MRKLFLLSAFCLSALFAVSQPDTVYSNQGYSNYESSGDFVSQENQELIKDVVTLAVQHAVPGIPAPVTGGVIALIIAAVFRFFGKRKHKKKLREIEIDLAAGKKNGDVLSKHFVLFGVLMIFGLSLSAQYGTVNRDTAAVWKSRASASGLDVNSFLVGQQKPSSVVTVTPKSDATFTVRPVSGLSYSVIPSVGKDESNPLYIAPADPSGTSGYAMKVSLTGNSSLAKQNEQLSTGSMSLTGCRIITFSVTAASNPTDLFRIFAPINEVVFIKKITVQGNQTTPGAVLGQLYFRSSNNTGGTTTTVTAASPSRFQQQFNTSSTIVQLYSANPSGLGSGAVLITQKMIYLSPEYRESVFSFELPSNVNSWDSANASTGGYLAPQYLTTGGGDNGVYFNLQGVSMPGAVFYVTVEYQYK